jgi:hypothetical protein
MDALFADPFTPLPNSEPLAFSWETAPPETEGKPEDGTGAPLAVWPEPLPQAGGSPAAPAPMADTPAADAFNFNWSAPAAPAPETPAAGPSQAATAPVDFGSAFNFDSVGPGAEEKPGAAPDDGGKKAPDSP